jgi:hypothetical protein
LRSDVNVRDNKGTVEEWVVEMDRPEFLRKNGWTSSTVKSGDGARTMRCTTVELSNGEKLRS